VHAAAVATSRVAWDLTSSCQRCEFALDCGAVRMCLAHPTGATRMAAVVRAVRAMRANLAEPLSLSSLAHAALLSPFHFHRVFRHVTATTPARFLTALRIAEATRLLACTPTSMTEVSARVGYAGLGTFTSQFTRLVGTPPRSFRELMALLGHRPVAEVLAGLAATPPAAAGTVDQDSGPIGLLAGGPHQDAVVLLGLFDTGVPQPRPAACAVTTGHGVVRLAPVPDGVYHPLAVGFDPAATVIQALTDHRAPVRSVGAGARPLVVRDGRADRPFHLALRRPRITDPPVVTALPLVLAAELSIHADSR